jgi:hypothetical protein
MTVDRAILFLPLLLSLPLPAGAALGGPASSVEADRAHMQAERKTSAGQRYTIHEISTPSGTVVREFVSTLTGTVFAVAWQGPFMPDLQQVLGDHFKTFAEATEGAGPARGSVSVHRPEVVIHSGGHMRAFSGMAYLPGQIPEGVQIEDIR